LAGQQEPWGGKILGFHITVTDRSVNPGIAALALKIFHEPRQNAEAAKHGSENLMEQ
jgi:hypothetical protein